MKKLLLILLCLPMIGFGQDSELSKYNNDTQFNFSLETGLTIQTDINAFFDSEILDEINPIFTVFYFKGNSNYDISLNRMFDFYNKLSMSFKYRNGGVYELPLKSGDGVYVKDFSLFNTQLFYSGGMEMMIGKRIEQHFGVTITLLDIFILNRYLSDIEFFNYNHPSLMSWGGINYEIDYLISNKFSINFALGRMMLQKPFNNGLYNFTFNDWITEISFGTTYTF